MSVAGYDNSNNDYMKEDEKDNFGDLNNVLSMACGAFISNILVRSIFPLRNFF